MKGAGGGRPRKPEGTTRHRNKPTRTDVKVEVSAKVPTIPPPALPLTGVRREIWDTMWSHPIATLWATADIAALTRLVILQTTPAALADRGILAEIRQLEDRYLLNPYARAQQRVVLTTDGQPEAEASVSELDDYRRRLRSG